MTILRDVLYVIGLIFALPVLGWRRVVRGKRHGGVVEKLGGVPRRAGTKPCLWVHGVSVGEVLAARTLVEGFSRRCPEWDVVVSSTTDAGIAAARRTFPGCLVIRYPADFSFAVRRSFTRIRPTLVVLMELEIWPNFIALASARGVPVVVANGRISDRGYARSRRFRFLLRGSFARLTRVGAQTEETARRFESLGTPRERIIVTGSLKYDAEWREVPDAAGLARDLGLGRDSKVIVAGSTAPGEEEILLDVYARLRKEFPTLRLIIVPRHPERFDAVAALIRARGFPCLRRTSPAADVRTDDAVVLGDTMGEIMRFYVLASAVFVGKSLVAPGGGQNLIEPAVLGKPVVFGPFVANFRETRDLLVSRSAAREVSDAEGLFVTLKQLLADERLSAEMGARARATVESARGATQRTLDILQDSLASGRAS